MLCIKYLRARPIEKKRVCQVICTLPTGDMPGKDSRGARTEAASTRPEMPPEVPKMKLKWRCMLVFQPLFHIFVTVEGYHNG